ncbi:MAG: hypothetical protein E7535_08495 [Ruminococcaceae bacterium]|nr:hypothetical protein [Oscillospiraceae bacterium]
MKNILKKSLSVFLTVLMVISCFSVISPITAGAIPATDSTYARGDKYGTPAYTGTGDRWFKWATGSDYVTVYYPSQIYLDVSETLQSAGYHFDVEWHFGNNHYYRILLGAPVWGDHSAFSGNPSKYYTMTNIFSDYAVDASLPKGAPSGLYGSTSSSTDYDLRIMGYGHANQGTDGFTVNNARHNKYVLFRTNVNYYNPASASIYLMGTPSSSYAGTTTEYNTSGASIGSYGLAQQYNSGKWGTHDATTAMFMKKGSSSSYMEGEWIEMQWFVTVYDKSALNSEIVKAGQIISANQNYKQYVVSGSFDGLVQKNSEAQTAITTRATTQSNINDAKNSLYNAASGLTFGASNTALRELVSQAEAIINSTEYVAKYTENSRNALENALADAKALSYYNSVPTYNAYNITLAGSNAASDQAAINSTADALAAAINALGNNIAFYSYNFNMADGSVKQASGAYGYTIPQSSIPAHSVKAADENYHYSYIWDKEINYIITGADEYTEVLVTEEHGWDDWFVTVDPDCDTKGEKTRQCISCGYTETAEIPADGHTQGAPVISDEVAPSCSAEGSYRETISCEICGVVISEKTVPVPKTEHTKGESVKENEVAPSCTADGSYDEVVRCTVCGEIISSKTVTVGAAHQDGEPEVQREESTCDKAGFVKTTVSCTVCGEVLSETTEELPLAEHSPAEAVKENEVEADCVNDGSYDMVVYCSVCGEKLSETSHTEPKLDHDMGPFIITTPPTCTEDGVATAECSRCDYTETKAAPSDGHIEEEIPAVVPTCTEDGATAGVKCFVCDEVIVAPVTEPKLGHDMSDFEEKIPATCLYDGEKEAQCSRCDYYETKTIPATGHTEEIIPAKEPTCTEDGNHEGKKCSVCGEILDEAEVYPSTGHSMGPYIDEVLMDCVTDGVARADCSLCDYFDIKTTKAKGHTEKAVAGLEPTCTEDGYEAGIICADCGEVIEGTGWLPATGHKEAEAVIENEVEADCENDGSYDSVVYCSVCGEALSRETTVVPAEGHKEAEAVIKNEVEADCENDGSYDSVVYCSVCGEELSRETKTVPALGHDMSEFTEDTPATCEDDGVSRSDCSRCDYYETDVIPATGHTEAEAVTENEVEADCENDGSYDSVVYCSVCGEALSRKTVTVPATGHDWGEWETDVPASCGTDGQDKRICKNNASHIETRPVLATGEHVYASEKKRVEATCTEDGYVIMACLCGAEEKTVLKSEGHKDGELVIENEVEADCVNNGSYDTVVYCSVCGEELSRVPATVPALGHKEGTPVTENEVEADCVNDGSYDTVVYCTVCNGELSRETTVVPAEGHKEGEAVTENEIEATCENTGSYDTVVYCTVCNGELSRVSATVPALGHKDGEPVIENEVKATCETDGSYDKVIYCTVCGGEVSRSSAYVPAEGHKEEILPEKEPTCTEDGLTAGVKCSVCGEILTAQETVPATGHKMGEFTETKPATCKEAGEMRADCENCDHYETKAIEKLPHEEEIIPAVAPTCTENGLTEGVKCSVCGEILTAQTAVKAQGHKLGEWKTVREATCTEDGLEAAECVNCDYTKTRVIPEKGHEFGEDGICEECGAEEKCPHICHKEHNIFARIVWTIIRFICSLFGVGRTCSCGEAHY